MTLLVGTMASPELLRTPHGPRQALVRRILDSGIDHMFIADHVSFRVGTGMDGLVNAATLAAIDPRLKVVVGVYLLALRNPVVVARQMATLSEAAPGQLILGVGVGGEDRNEFKMCGIDPRTRGARTNEALAILEGLAAGEPFDFKGDFFQFERAWVRPAPNPRVPILIGGRSDAALERAARFGDGWLGVWCSPERFAAAIKTVDDGAKDSPERRASARGNSARPPALHGLQLWVGVGNDKERARGRLAKAMWDFYRIPFERFERYSPSGTPREIAAYLTPFRDAGCRLFNLTPIAESEEAAVDAVAEVKRLLA